MMSLFRWWLILLAMVGGLRAQESLVIQNRPVYTFRAGLGPLSPAERALRARERLDAIPLEQLTSPVQIQPSPEGLVLKVGDHPLFILLPGDLEPGMEGSLANAAERVRASLLLALKEEREQRDLRHLLWALGQAALATVAAALGLRILLRGRRWLHIRLARFQAARMPRLGIGGFVLLDGLRLRRALNALLWGIGTLLILLLAYSWLTYVLGRFPFTRPYGAAMGTQLASSTLRLASGLFKALPGLAAVALIIVITHLLGRLSRAFFSAVEKGDVELDWLHPETAAPTRRILNALLWMFAVVMAYPYVPGSGSLAFKGMSVFIGVLVSMGSTGVVNQSMSGLVLMYSRAFRPGDVIRVGEVEGIVTELNLLSTKLRTILSEEITLPNAVVLGTPIQNYTRLSGEAGLVALTTVTIGYDAPWRQVHALLLQAAADTPGLRQTPAPYVLQKALSDFYVEYQLHIRLDDPFQRPFVFSELHARIQDSFNTHGVQIMSPHFLADKSAPVVVPPERWHLAPASPPEAPSATT